MKILVALVVAAFGIAVVVVGAGQLGLLAGSAPMQLGMTNGRLSPPSANPNSVSSQAALYPATTRSKVMQTLSRLLSRATAKRRWPGWRVCCSRRRGR